MDDSTRSALHAAIDRAVNMPSSLPPWWTPAAYARHTLMPKFEMFGSRCADAAATIAERDADIKLLRSEARTALLEAAIAREDASRWRKEAKTLKTELRRLA